jgi:hypothetical protein
VRTTFPLAGVAVVNVLLAYHIGAEVGRQSPVITTQIDVVSLGVIAATLMGAMQYGIHLFVESLPPAEKVNKA